MFIWVLVNVCVCEGERRMAGCWVSAGPLHSSLTDRISERALQWLRAAWRTAAEWSFRISRQNQGRDGNRAGGEADLRTVDQALLGKNHINICSSIIHILIEECVFVCVDGVCVFQSCLLAWLMNGWISWLMTLSLMGSIHVQQRMKNMTQFSPWTHNIRHIKHASCDVICSRNAAQELTVCNAYSNCTFSGERQGEYARCTVVPLTIMCRRYMRHSVVKNISFFCIIKLIGATLSMKTPWSDCYLSWQNWNVSIV